MVRFFIVILVGFLILRTESLCKDDDDISPLSASSYTFSPSPSPDRPGPLTRSLSEKKLPGAECVDEEAFLETQLKAIRDQAELCLKRRKHFDGQDPKETVHDALTKAVQVITADACKDPKVKIVTAYIAGIRTEAIKLAKLPSVTIADSDDAENLVRGLVMDERMFELHLNALQVKQEPSVQTLHYQLLAVLNPVVKWQGRPELLSLWGELQDKGCGSLFVLKNGIKTAYGLLGSFATSTMSCGLIMGSLGKITNISGGWTTAVIVTFMLTHAPSEYETHTSILRRATDLAKRLFCCGCRRTTAEEALFRERTRGHSAALFSIHLLNIAEAGAWTAVTVYVMSDFGPFFGRVAPSLFGLSMLAAEMGISEEEISRHFGGKRASHPHVLWYALHQNLQKPHTNEVLARIYDDVFAQDLASVGVSPPQGEHKGTPAQAEPEAYATLAAADWPLAAPKPQSIISIFGDHDASPQDLLSMKPGENAVYRVLLENEFRSRLNWQGRGTIGVVLLALPGWMIALGAGAGLIRPELAWIGHGVGALLGIKTWLESRFYERTFPAVLKRSSAFPIAWAVIPAAGYGAFPACLVILSGQTIGWGWIPVAAACLTQGVKKLHSTTQGTASFLQRCSRWGWDQTKRKAAVMRGYLRAGAQLLNRMEDSIIEQIAPHVFAPICFG